MYGISIGRRLHSFLLKYKGWVDWLEVDNLEVNEDLDISEVIVLVVEILLVMNQTIANSTNIYFGLLVEELLDRKITTQDDLIRWISQGCTPNIAYYNNGVPDFFDNRVDTVFGVPEELQPLYNISYPLNEFIKEALKLDQNQQVRLPKSMNENKITMPELRNLLLEIFENDKDKYYCKTSISKNSEPTYYKEVIMLKDSKLAHPDIFDSQAITRKQLLRCIDSHLFLYECYKTTGYHASSEDESDIIDPAPLSSISFDGTKVEMIFAGDEIARLPLIDVSNRTDVYEPDSSLPRAEEESTSNLSQGKKSELSYLKIKIDDDSSNSEEIPPLE